MSRRKLIIFDAVVRSKLMYGLESAQPSESLESKLDAFPLKGLRKILGMTRTFISRGNTNALVYNRANAEVNKPPTPTSENRHSQTPKTNHIIELSVYYDSCRRATPIDIIEHRNDDKDPRPNMTINK